MEPHPTSAHAGEVESHFARGMCATFQVDMVARAVGLPPVTILILTRVPNGSTVPKVPSAEEAVMAQSDLERPQLTVPEVGVATASR